MTRKLLFLSFFAAIHVACFGQNIKYDNTVDILNQKNEGIQHEAGDIEVVWVRDRYQIDFYIKQEGKVIPHGAQLQTFDIYDKVDYVWESKSKVAIRLYNSTTGKEFPLKVYGDKNGTGMEVDTTLK